jgi:hypothetical protein
MSDKKDIKIVDESDSDAENTIEDDIWEIQCRLAIIEEFMEFNFAERVKEFRDYKNKQFKLREEEEKKKKATEVDKFLGTAGKKK